MLGGFYFNEFNIEGISFKVKGLADPYIVKYSTEGNLLWAKEYGSYKEENCVSIASDFSGNIFLTGSFSDSCTFGNLSESSMGSSDIYLAKFDENGFPMWLNTVRSSKGIYPRDITSDKSNNLILIGVIKDSTYFNDSIVIHGNENSCDMFIARFKNNGNCLWAIDDGDGGWCQGISVATDSLSSIYVTGFFSDSAYFNNNEVRGLNQDVFLLKYDSSGAYQYVETVGGSNYDCGNDIVLDEYLNPYIIGQFQNIIKFDGLEIQGYGNDDIFLCKYAPSESIIKVYKHPIDINACHSSDTLLSVGVFEKKLNFQWVKDGLEILGATDSVYIISSLSENDNGYYLCKISNGETTIESNIAKITTHNGPEILNQSIDQTIYKGRRIDFLVDSRGINQTFLWKKDGVVLTNEVFPMLTIQVVDYADSGIYICQITDDCGQMESEPIKLSVLSPANIIKVNKVDFRIYPNPTSSILHITLSNELKNGKLEIYNSSGQKITSMDVNSSDYIINIEHLPKGNYFISLKTSETYNTNTFIKL